mmetsp:Transcript_49262/g.114165  ORF Transcript_49262/g.114165 Transcript_49262/m.114165 type:complete len:564 (+) Transcript_49262:150-1841(+)
MVTGESCSIRRNCLPLPFACLCAKRLLHPLLLALLVGANNAAVASACTASGGATQAEGEAACPTSATALPRVKSISLVQVGKFTRRTSQPVVEEEDEDVGPPAGVHHMSSMRPIAQPPVTGSLSQAVPSPAFDKSMAASAARTVPQRAGPAPKVAKEGSTAARESAPTREAPPAAAHRATQGEAPQQRDAHAVGQSAASESDRVPARILRGWHMAMWTTLQSWRFAMGRGLAALQRAASSNRVSGSEGLIIACLVLGLLLCVAAISLCVLEKRGRAPGTWGLLLGHRERRSTPLLNHVQAGACSTDPRAGPHMQVHRDRSRSGALSPKTPVSPTPLEQPSKTPSPRGVSKESSPPKPDQQKPGSALESYFCPDLVVPKNCECVLRVPKSSAGGGGGSFDVTDMSGNVVLHIESRRGPNGAADVCTWRLVLMTSYGNALAQCGPTAPLRPSEDAKDFVLIRPSGDCFAQFTQDEGQERYTMKTRAGTQLYFWGSHKQYAMNVTDDSGKLLATTETREEAEEGCMSTPNSRGNTSSCYRLRVAPLMDVGLVLCGLLCIEHFTSSL